MNFLFLLLLGYGGGMFMMTICLALVVVVVGDDNIPSGYSNPAVAAVTKQSVP